VDIKNNICFQNKLYGIYFYAATGSGVVMDHNLIYGNGAGDYSSFSNGGSKVTYTLGTTISSDPLFVTEASAGFDAHLSTNSPAIGAGYNFNSLFTTDMAGTARPSNGAWDLGSYVFGAGVTNPITGGNSLHATISKDTDNAMRITWSSVVGKVYRVASKNSLSDSTWADLSGLLTATSTTTSYTDTTASRQPQRFYVVYVTN